ncbi:MAG: flavin monoamine oxidase family protein, partial [Cyanobium sp.]
PVEALTQEGGAVRVQWGGGAQTSAAAVVVAIPPPLRLGIRFDPPLPPEQVALLQRSPMGAMVKVLAVYPRPFWRQQGLNGLGIGNLPLLELTADCSPPAGPGLLVGFIAADRARRWRALSEPQRRRQVLDDLVSLWGAPAGEPIDLVQHDWCAESWSGGAFTSFLVPGAWSRFGRHWQTPHGRVIWAGTEVASRWPGYFEGALEAGGSAAAQVRRLLDGDHPR